MVDELAVVEDPVDRGHIDEQVCESVFDDQPHCIGGEIGRNVALAIFG